MKTAISIPDAVFRQADRLARRLGKSRSEIYAAAVAEYVRRWDPDEITQAIDAALGGLAAGDEAQKLVARAARRTLRRSTW